MGLQSCGKLDINSALHIITVPQISPVSNLPGLAGIAPLAIRCEGRALATLLHTAGHQDSLLRYSLSTSHQKCQIKTRCPFSEIVEHLRWYSRHDLSNEQWQQVVWDYILNQWHISWQIDKSDLLSHEPTGYVVLTSGLTHICTTGAS